MDVPKQEAELGWACPAKWANTQGPWRAQRESGATPGGLRGWSLFRVAGGGEVMGAGALLPRLLAAHLCSGCDSPRAARWEG